MKVCEIFASIQGESTYAGLPCVFIRLTGCNLRCVYCDTAYAYDEGREMSLEEIVEAVIPHGIGLVEVTGGEPLLQAETRALVAVLLDKGFGVLIETNGSVDIGGVDRRAVIIMDIKTPGSGMSGEMALGNLKLLTPRDEVKFVITGRDDYEWTKGFIKTHGLEGRCKILLSPAYGALPPRELLKWILEDRLPVRLNLQLHKYIFDPCARGV